MSRFDDFRNRHEENPTFLRRPRKGLFILKAKNRISAWHIGKARYPSAIPGSFASFLSVSQSISRMKKDTILQNVRIDKLVFGGKGLAQHEDGRKIMVSGGAIPGQVVNLRVLKSKKNYLEAQIVDVVAKSPFEGELPAHYQVYGGCKWLPIEYSKQLEIKEEQVKDALRVVRDKLSGAVFHPIVASPEIYGYRNKVEFSWGKYISAKEGVHDEFRFGFHKQGEFDRIVDCEYCVLADDRINEIFAVVRDYSRDSGLPTYDPKTQVGFWRHFVVRKSKTT